MMGRFCILLSFVIFILPLEGAILLSAGPEIFHMQRFREGGAWQSGRIDGIRFAIDRIKKGYGWYLGADYLYATGKLAGLTPTGRRLKSCVTDSIWEGRVGFSLQSAVLKCAYFIPFGGYGFFKENNNFCAPSPIPVKFEDTFNYVVAGFLSGANLTPLLSIGINFKIRFMLNGQSRMTDDPLFDDLTLMMQNETHYRLDLPITYSKCAPSKGLAIQLAPFYEFRHFGGREGFPFNFRDTKFHLWGAKLALIYGF